MKVGSLVKTMSGRLGIVESIDSGWEDDEDGYCYPFHVYMFDSNWCVEFFKEEHLELLDESR